MGRWKAWALAWLLGATLSALLLQAPSARGDELLVNGGFEDGLEGWACRHCVAAAVASPLAPETTGSQAVELAGKASSSLEFYLEIYQDVPVVSGDEYVFSGYYAVRDGRGIEDLRLRVTWWYWDGGAMVEVDPVPDDAPADILHDASYRLLDTGPRTARPNAEFARVKVLVKRTTQAATVYLDDFSFTGPSVSTPTLTPTQTPPLTASPSPTVSPSPSPGPIGSPTPSPVATPSPTAVPTATEVPSAARPPVSTPKPTSALVNGGFEKAEDDGRPVGWRKYGGELSRSSAAKWEGQFAAAFTSRTASTKWAFQTVAVQGGEAYVLSGYVLKNDANVEAAYLRLSWYASADGSGKAIDSVDSTTRLTDDSPRFRFLTTDAVVAPAEAASAKVRLMLDPVSEADSRVYFDAISFGETAMPPQAVQTSEPPPPSASSEHPTAAVAVPAASPEQPEPSLRAAEPPRSPSTVLGDAAASTETSLSARDESSQSEAGLEARSTRTPVVLYRERKPAQSTHGGEGLVAMSEDGDALSPVVPVLVMALPVTVVAATGIFVWWRWRKKARLP